MGYQSVPNPLEIESGAAGEETEEEEFKAGIFTSLHIMCIVYYQWFIAITNYLLNSIIGSSSYSDCTNSYVSFLSNITSESQAL